MSPLQTVEKVFSRNLRWVLFFSFAANALLLAVPLYMLQIYDRVLHSGSTETLAVVSLVIVALLALFGVLSGVLDLLLSSLGGFLAVQLSPHIFSLQRGAGTISAAGSLADQVEELRRFFNSGTPANLISGLWIPLFLLVLFLFHPVLGVIGLFGAGILLAIAIIGDGRLSARHSRSLKKKRNSQELMKSIMAQRDSVIALGMEGALGKAWLSRYRNSTEAAEARYSTAAVVRAVMRTARLLLQILMLGSGAYLALNGEISAGMIVASSIMMTRALAPVEGALTTWRSAGRARAAYQALRRELDRNGSIRSEIAIGPGSLVVKDLAIAAHARERDTSHGSSSRTAPTPLFPPISFSVEPGECLAIIGPVGSGKSLLLRTLLGLHPAIEGRVDLCGRTIDHGRPPHFGSQIGYMGPVPQFFPGTIAENISRFSEGDPQEVVAAAEMARLHRHVLGLKDGYDTSVSSDGSPLSSGQTRQLAMARALYGSPPFLFLDDPTAGLDVVEEAAFVKTLERLKSDRCAIILVTHSSRVLAQCDKMLVLRHDEYEYLPDKAAVKERLRNSAPATLPRRSALAGER